MGKRHPEKQREGMCTSVEKMRSGIGLPHNAYKATIGGGCLHHSLSAFRPASTNGPKNNEKKIKRLVEPIEVHAFQEMERYSIGKSLLFVPAQAACRARKTLERSLIVVFGSVSTRGPSYSMSHVQEDHDEAFLPFAGIIIAELTSAAVVSREPGKRSGESQENRRLPDFWRGSHPAPGGQEEQTRLPIFCMPIPGFRGVLAR